MSRAARTPSTLQAICAILTVAAACGEVVPAQRDGTAPPPESGSPGPYEDSGYGRYDAGGPGFDAPSPSNDARVSDSALDAEGGADAEAPQPDAGGPGPDAGEGGGPEHPLVSMLTGNLNVDALHSFVEGSVSPEKARLDYLEAVKARLGAGFIVGYRENLSTDVDYPKTMVLPAPHRAMIESEYLKDLFVILHAMPGNANGKPGNGSQLAGAVQGLSHEAWLRNVRWGTRKKLEALAGQTRIVLANNEPDITGIGSGKGSLNAYEVLLEDIAASDRFSEAGKRLQRSRVIWAMKAVYQELKGIEPPSGMAASSQSAHIFGPTVAYPTIEHSGAAQQQWALKDIFEQFDGEILSWMDGVTVHNHRVMSVFETYDNTPPTAKQGSLYQAWRAIELANAKRRAAGRPQHGERCLPVMTDEAGLMWESAPGTWSGGTVLYPESPKRGGGTLEAFTSHRAKLREYRDGMQMMASCWFGLSLVTHYSLSFSGHRSMNRWDPRYNGAQKGADGLYFKPFPDWETLRRIWDPKNYDIETKPLTFPSKSWTEYHLPYSWGVYIDQGKAPDARPLLDPPYSPWKNVTFGPGGVVTMTPGNGAPRNLIMRPVWLRRPGAVYVVRVKVNFPDTAAGRGVKLRVRGFDKLDGLANLEQEVKGNDPRAMGDKWLTLEQRVVHRGHGLAHLPSPNYLLIAIDHNAQGTVRLKDPEIVVAPDRAGEPMLRRCP